MRTSDLQSFLASRPDLLKPNYRKKVEAGAHPLTGHCYVASEAWWHLAGGPTSGLVPCTIRHEGSVHWYLKHRETGEITDLTADQFSTPVPYHKGRGRGFLTKEPSKRARIVMEAL